MQTLNINPLFKNALRPLEPDEYERLSTSIEAEGCHTPLMTWNGFIIAGHNRYQICRETGQSFKVENRDDDFADETEVLIWILDDALSGRNLDATDKRKYIGELYSLKKLKDEERAQFNVDKSVHVGDTAENIGLQFGVSSRTVRRYANEYERQKLLKEIAEQVQKKAAREGKLEDEDWMREQLDEASQDLQGDDESESFDTGADDFNQDEPTEEQRAERKAAMPKRSKSKTKSIVAQQKHALKSYRSALDKIQGLRLDLLCPDVLLPDFGILYASIDKAMPLDKPKFGR